MIPKNLCLNCMSGREVNGICERCGKPVPSENRIKSALPLRFLLKNRYYIGRILGKGGFGITYLAWDCNFDIPVAVKELFPNNTVSRDEKTMSIVVNDGKQDYFNHVRKWFRDEAQTISNLRNYPEIINTYDLFDEYGTTYYVMEYLDGEDLARRLARTGEVTWEDIEKPIWDSVQTLKILHGHKLIHRDITPDNIIVLKKGNAKLIDFGSVRNVDSEHFTVLVKHGYAPLEMYNPNGNQGPWTDTFSLSATIYYMLSKGGRIERSDIRKNNVDSNRPDPLVPLQNYNPKAPDYVVNAVMEGMSLKIEDRIQSAEDFQRLFFPSTVTRNKKRTCTLVCRRGLLQGRVFPLPENVTVAPGRVEADNQIVFPPNYRGISRHHCAFMAGSDGTVYVQDKKSTCGTFIGNRMLSPYVWYKLERGQTITVGDGNINVFQLV